MLQSVLCVALAATSLIYAQQIGKKPEVHPGLTTQKCTRDAGCVTQNTSVVIDSLTHPIKDLETGKSCTTSDGKINKNVCNTTEECSQKCSIQGVNYIDHGVETKDASMTLHMYAQGDYGKVKKLSPRVYLLDETGEDYSMLQLRGQEVSFDVDMSNLPCGMNGALYLSEMNKTGNRGELNPAGAKYGTGYCDAQCFNTSAFLNGVANVDTKGVSTLTTNLKPHCGASADYVPGCDRLVAARWTCGKPTPEQLSTRRIHVTSLPSMHVPEPSVAMKACATKSAAHTTLTLSEPKTSTALGRMSTQRSQ